MRLIKRLSVYFVCVAFGLIFWWVSENSNGTWPLAVFNSDRSSSENPNWANSSSAIKPEHFGEVTLQRFVDRVLKGESLSLALSRNGISSQDAHLIANVLRGEINLKQIRPGDTFIIERNSPAAKTDPGQALNGEKRESTFDAFEIIRTDGSGLPTRFRIQHKSSSLQRNTGYLNKAEDFELKRYDTKVTVQQDALSGAIESSLYDAIIHAGGDPALVNRYSELFGWQIDFYRETQRGDRFKMLVESKYADGRFVGYGKVSAGEYTTGNRVFRGFYYESVDGENSGVYDENGTTLEKTFLKSPLELARITSRYGQRFHPVLRTAKKHNGVDYGASTGTPFWSVADGVVLEARYSPTAGNMIRIKHRNGYTTEYFHASRIAQGIRAGAHVKQRQIIGYVGTTGRSTGPHLHFGMLTEKRYVDPSKQNFPTGHALPKREMALYQEKIRPLLAGLEQIAANNS